MNKYIVPVALLSCMVGFSAYARNFDGTGPQGFGPMTGHGMGNCEKTFEQRCGRDGACRFASGPRPVVLGRAARGFGKNRRHMR